MEAFPEIIRADQIKPGDAVEAAPFTWWIAGSVLVEDGRVTVEFDPGADPDEIEEMGVLLADEPADSTWAVVPAGPEADDLVYG